MGNQRQRLDLSTVFPPYFSGQKPCAYLEHVSDEAFLEEVSLEEDLPGGCRSLGQLEQNCAFLNQLTAQISQFLESDTSVGRNTGRVVPIPSPCRVHRPGRGDSRVWPATARPSSAATCRSLCQPWNE